MEFSANEISKFRDGYGGENDCKKNYLTSEKYNAFRTGLRMKLYTCMQNHFYPRFNSKRTIFKKCKHVRLYD